MSSNSVCNHTRPILLITRMITDRSWTPLSPVTITHYYYYYYYYYILLLLLLLLLLLFCYFEVKCLRLALKIVACIPSYGRKWPSSHHDIMIISMIWTL